VEEDRRTRRRCQVVFCSLVERVGGRTREFAASHVAAEKEIPARLARKGQRRGTILFS